MDIVLGIVVFKELQLLRLAGSDAIWTGKVTRLVGSREW
jgi:hypothetical protein